VPHSFLWGFFVGNARSQRGALGPVASKGKLSWAVVRRLRALALGPLALALGLLAILPPAVAAKQSASTSASRTSILEVTDEAGRAVRVAQPVRRIVSLAPNLTETIFALGMGDVLVGDTDYCDYPPEALKKTHVGGPVNPSLEEIMALHPDLVLATPTINRLVTVQALERLGVAVYVADPRTVEQVLSSTERLASMLGASEQASKLVMSLRDRLEQLRERLSGSEPRSVFFVTWVDPLISVGRDTFLSDALRLAGARSVIATPQDWPNINLEEVLHLQPEYLIFSSDDPGQIQRQVAELRGRPGWQGLEALRQNRIIILSEAISRPAPRLLDAIEQLARALHPDRFTSEHPVTPASAASPSPIFSLAMGAL
jgi:iron complex transport system substrate-binding protein